MSGWLRSKRGTKRSSHAFPESWDSCESNHGGFRTDVSRDQRPQQKLRTQQDSNCQDTSKPLYLPSAANPAPTVTIPNDSNLNPEQRLVVESVLSGYSTFFTGPAGSGKSHILDSISKLNSEGKIAPKKKIVVTATTGLAGCNIGGVTIHSFAGVGTGAGTLSSSAARVMGNHYAKQRWRECDILVIDEISMMSASFLDMLAFVASRARNDRRIFGGIQLVVLGDFFQLPPIDLNKNKFAFEAECWPKVIQSTIFLKQIFRQNQDSVLTSILNEARIGELSDESIHLLRNHSERAHHSKSSRSPISNPKPTMLECRNAAVDRLNAKELTKLPGKVHVFTARDRAIDSTYEAQLKHCPATDRLELKVGARVMLLKNLDVERGFVNGVCGTVEEFRCHPKPIDMVREMRHVELPVVRFDQALYSKDGNSHHIDDDTVGDDRLRLIEPAEWTNKIGDCTVSFRIQIPLRLGYSITVHKSQGMTIPHLAVNLSGAFEYGQGYVALSRATCLDSLVLSGFSEHTFRAHPKVKQFYCMFEGKKTEKKASISAPSGREIKGLSSTYCAHSPDLVSLQMDSSLEFAKAASLQAITPDQRRRTEENRQRALAICKRNISLPS